MIEAVGTALRAMIVSSLVCFLPVVKSGLEANGFYIDGSQYTSFRRLSFSASLIANSRVATQRLLPRQPSKNGTGLFSSIPLKHQ
jgi:hypothetical protein